MIINLAYLNASNGMFWYAVDKIRSLGDESATILVAPHLEPLVRKMLPGHAVQARGKLGSAQFILKRKLQMQSPERVVTFTSHPMPFVGDQTIAFYDDYPFAGSAGRFKKWLFAAAAKTSRCRIGIINRSLAVPFLTSLNIPDDRIFFDSAFPSVDLATARERPHEPQSPLRIGLVGTDSLKKNYADIFAAVEAQGHCDAVRFLLYGAENDYTAGLKRDFPDIDFQIVASDNIGPVEFFDGVDYLMSAALAEGYGRPMGLAAALGVPMFLLKSPVFIEFFGQHARFFDNVPDMIRHVAETRPPAAAPPAQAVSTAKTRSPFFD